MHPALVLQHLTPPWLRIPLGHCCEGSLWVALRGAPSLPPPQLTVWVSVQLGVASGRMGVVLGWWEPAWAQWVPMLAMQLGQWAPMLAMQLGQWAPMLAMQLGHQWVPQTAMQWHRALWDYLWGSLWDAGWGPWWGLQWAQWGLWSVRR